MRDWGFDFVKVRERSQGSCTNFSSSEIFAI